MNLTKGEREGEGRNCGPGAYTPTHRLQHYPAHKGEERGRGEMSGERGDEWGEGRGEERGEDRQKLWAESLDPNTQTSTLPSPQGRGKMSEERRGERTGRSCGPEALTPTHRLQHCPANKGEAEGRRQGEVWGCRQDLEKTVNINCVPARGLQLAKEILMHKRMKNTKLVQ